MKTKKINFGFRGWMLVIYQTIAFLAWTAFCNYPLNILADFYGGAEKLSTIFTVCTFIGIAIQLGMNRIVGKMKSIKTFSGICGLIFLLCSLGIMLIPSSQAGLWCVCYAIANVTGTMYATFSIGILVGQWFPTRKGTIMGLTTIAFPIGNGLVGLFASSVFRKGAPDIFGAFLPFFIISVLGWLAGVIFLRDYPEQCGCFRDNDRNMTAEVARKLMEEEIENKRTTVWKGGKILKCRDFWFATIPAGFLLLFSVGTMMQTSSIFSQFEQELSPLGGYTGVMMLICVLGCIGSYVIGLLDTKFGTKKALIISAIIMIVCGAFGMIPRAEMLIVSMVLLALFMGAASNFTVSVAAQYWRREDFGSVFAVLNPIANIFNAVGPMVVTRLLFTSMGYQAIFLGTAIAGVISVILLVLFRPGHIKQLDDRYRTEAGKMLDDALLGRK